MDTTHLNALEYCLEKNGAPPSSLHYALLFQPPVLKLFWLGCFTLHHELRLACLKQLDSGLTQVKLGWWVNALGKASESAKVLDIPSLPANNHLGLHPVINAIGSLAMSTVDIEHWSDLVSSVEASCKVSRHDTFEQWRDTLRGEYIWWLPLIRKAGQLETDEPAEQQVLNFLAASGQLVQLLRLAKFVDEQFNPLPLQWMQQHGITHNQLKARENTPAMQGLMLQCAKAIMDHAQANWASLPPPWKLHLRPLRALYRMRLAEFEILRSNGLPILTEQAMLTPLKKFGISWTTQVLRY